MDLSHLASAYSGLLLAHQLEPVLSGSPRRTGWLQLSFANVLWYV